MYIRFLIYARQIRSIRHIDIIIVCPMNNSTIAYSTYKIDSIEKLKLKKRFRKKKYICDIYLVYKI